MRSITPSRVVGATTSGPRSDRELSHASTADPWLAVGRLAARRPPCVSVQGVPASGEWHACRRC